jgi:hypothetical protein
MTEAIYGQQIPGGGEDTEYYLTNGSVFGITGNTVYQVWMTSDGGDSTVLSIAGDLSMSSIYFSWLSSQ